MSLALPPVSDAAEHLPPDDKTPAELKGSSAVSGVEGSSEPFEPAKIMRIGTMIRALLSEVRHAPLDEAGRDLMHDIYQKSVDELSGALAPPLREELERITQPFSSEMPTEVELRLAQAQLVGWLEGLFHGIQAAVAAQREMAEQQLRQMLPSNELRSVEKSTKSDRGSVYL